MILVPFHYFIFLTLYKWRKKPGLERKRSLRIFQTAYVRKVRPRAQPGLSCRPPAQPGGREKADQPKELAWHAGGGGLPEDRKLKIILEASGDSEL
jgi:hypothetical protein